MNLANLFALFAQAGKLSGHKEYVVIGSLAILALEGAFDVPAGMTISNDVDAYTPNDPDRIFELNGALGENSAYHVQSGYYLDPVSPSLPSFPEGWRERLSLVERDGMKLWFVEPNDVAISKYARGEARDRRWIREGILVGVVSLPVVRSRFASARFDGVQEQQRAARLLAEDEAWFKGIRKSRGNPEPARQRRPSAL